MWNKWLALDTETTGLNSEARIVEIALVLFEQGEIVDRWSHLIYPENVDWGHVDVQRALQVNQLTVAELEGKPRFSSIASELLDRLSSQMIWVAHNIDFDLRMIRQELARLGDFPLPDSLALDTMTLDHRINNRPIVRGEHVVEAVAARWGVRPDGASHRAVTDAITCGRVLRQMVLKEALPVDYDAARTFQQVATAAWKQRTGRR